MKKKTNSEPSERISTFFSWNALDFWIFIRKGMYILLRL